MYHEGRETLKKTAFCTGICVPDAPTDSDSTGIEDADQSVYPTGAAVFADASTDLHSRFMRPHAPVRTHLRIRPGGRSTNGH